MMITFEAISGMMVGIEFLEGAMVLDLFIMRVMFIGKESPYRQLFEEEE